MRVVVLGGAGFIGSHLVDRLLGAGHDVVAVDSYLTGRRENLAHLQGASRFRLVEHDVCRPVPVTGPAAAVFNLASPASPLDYERLPLQTLEAGSAGTRNALDLARAAGAVLVHASTSEVYGDPLEHPQRETYFGNVNPVGPRACYDEAKRFAEALISAYARVNGTKVRIARVFNTYGPRMRVDDGRVVPAFITQAIRGQDFTDAFIEMPLMNRLEHVAARFARRRERRFEYGVPDVAAADLVSLGQRPEIDIVSQRRP